VKVYFLYSLIVITSLCSFALASDGGASAQCRREVFDIDEGVKSLDQLFEEAYHDTDVYKPLRCHRNVIDFFLNYLHPMYKASSFRVLIIYKRSYAKEFPHESTDTAKSFFPLKARRSRNGMQVPWVYHVVLVKGDKILDLDYQNPQWVTREEYKQNFLASDMNDLVAIEVSGSSYLWSSNIRINEPLALQNLRDGGKRYGLDNYLSKAP
jgi:hypothetical protein